MDALTRQTHHRETVLFLESMPALSALPFDELARISGLCGKVHLPKGEILFEQGDPGDAVFVIRRGAVEVFSRLPDGKEVVLARLNSHELVGEHYLLEGSNGVRSASVRAVAETELLRISQDSFSGLAKRHPDLIAALSRRRAKREHENLTRRSELYRLLCSERARSPFRKVHYPPGAIVFNEGDIPEAVYVVMAGVAIVFRPEAPDVTLAELGVGECFGERACISDRPRSASVRAKMPLDLQIIPKEEFLYAHDQSEELQTMSSALEFGYRLPSRGQAFQFTTRRDGEEAIERVYRLEDKREFLSTFLVRRNVFRLERLDVPLGPQMLEYAWHHPVEPIECVLRVEPWGTIHSLVVQGNWGQLPTLIEATLEGVAFTDEALAYFKREGIFPASVVTRSGQSFGVAMGEVACFCLNITNGRINDLLNEGVRTFESLRAKTGCGSVCGGCRTHVCDLIDPPKSVTVSTMARPLSPDVRAFTLNPPPNQAYPPWQAGQHVFLEGRIGGTWVGRSFIITGPAAARGALEITVRKEYGDRFTHWLFDGPPGEKRLRVSPPRGEGVRLSDIPGAVVVVHEIGVVMAVSLVRTSFETGSMTPIHVVYLGRDVKKMPYLSELKNAARMRDWISLEVHTGRMIKAQRKLLAHHLAKKYKNDHFYLCGMPNPLKGQRDMLMEAGVGDDRISEELMLPAGQQGADSGLGGVSRNVVVAGVVIAEEAILALIYFADLMTR